MYILELPAPERILTSAEWHRAQTTAGILVRRQENQLRSTFAEDLQKGFGFDTERVTNNLGALLYAQPKLLLSSCTVLDLGCGSVHEHGYPPWLLRSLGLIGHACTGVDLRGPGPYDAYQFVPGDITIAASLRKLPSKNYDLVCSFATLDLDALITDEYDASLSEFRDQLLGEVPRLLKPNGAFVYDVRYSPQG